MNSEKVGAELFLRLAEKIPVCDVRSPLEFNAGHIPGAFNIPIFSDKERESVGIKYKNEGRVPAIMEGLDLAGPNMSVKLDQALKLAEENHLLVHCWRGGMRSEAMAWLFSLAGIHIHVLDGGYKSYRHFILEKLSEKRKMIVLGGLTGSGKTHILNHLRRLGQQFIDMESLASHKGSAFGSLGQLPQPTTEHFANMLYYEWRGYDSEAPVWLEDESRNIGTVFMPDNLYENMQKSPAIIIMMNVKTRLPRLVEEYSKFPNDSLIASISRISKRLGGDNTRDAISAVKAGDFAKAIEITLSYYDKTYLFGLSRKSAENIIYVRTDTDNIAENAGRILEAAEKIKW
ncbi:MAG: tRNA 2-selenouridine(34) synthase MnmH [Bacteroidetes bacterium GWE2_41_25]|nr:MAG: tRNA 2-selenouridine(34) synthase MnmH [Bacteroidetes bacterium GWA2_40_15]OFX87975.1 MAG: tRNA 2-selenouridine(34) synthase MnmH [Bacteroidetes bacterium GWC2_40_22]OFY05496.1 MAG: tRNA 2-selenouridine(34) synthase MnmH [Bacteroidetes bacterium GWE2_41_25]OFY59928.1 MAG: tRNA 2-selenouridine(34) synthase MnmH [Bacteroidetes bacterium GWF2_41_9]HAM11277.1 tRNA 2-selenouridine(34) synthase MnmH [Bacteroidales bacterium]